MGHIMALILLILGLCVPNAVSSSVMSISSDNAMFPNTTSSFPSGTSSSTLGSLYLSPYSANGSDRSRLFLDCSSCVFTWLQAQVILLTEIPNSV